MKKYLITLAIITAGSCHNARAADCPPPTKPICAPDAIDAAYSKEYTRAWAEVPYRKTITTQQSLAAIFAQNRATELDPETQAAIKAKRAENRQNPDYVLPELNEVDKTKPSSKKFSNFLQLLKLQTIDQS